MGKKAKQMSALALSVTVSVMCERGCRGPLVVWALEDERKERLHWFHATIWMPGTLVTE